MKAALTRDVKVYLAWVRTHIGIEGNGEADKIANLNSWNGDLLRLPTNSGILANRKSSRKEWRTETSFGINPST